MQVLVSRTDKNVSRVVSLRNPEKPKDGLSCACCEVHKDLYLD